MMMIFLRVRGKCLVGGGKWRALYARVSSSESGYARENVRCIKAWGCGSSESWMKMV
jgi:hypothetical protein